MSPKVFGRLERLQRALTIGNASGEWAGTAVAAGYFDQSHMVREFRELMGETPVGFAALRKRAAGRVIEKDEDVAFILSGPARRC
jgi:AraC-like DNA-binding protein